MKVPALSSGYNAVIFTFIESAIMPSAILKRDRGEAKHRHSIFNFFTNGGLIFLSLFFETGAVKVYLVLELKKKKQEPKIILPLWLNKIKRRSIRVSKKKELAAFFLCCRNLN